MREFCIRSQTCQIDKHSSPFRFLSRRGSCHEVIVRRLAHFSREISKLAPALLNAPIRKIRTTINSVSPTKFSGTLLDRFIALRRHAQSGFLGSEC